MVATESTTWHGCYDGSWNSLIVPDAFAHPAKFSYALIRRIISYGLAQGFWRPGDVLGDPFGGVGLGGIVAAYSGLGWIGVELEPRFCALAKENFKLHRRKWEALSAPLPVILQGDSRRFASLVGHAAGCVTSPPYIETKVGGNNPEVERKRVARKLANGEIDPATAGKYSVHSQDIAPPYGTTPGQIGSLPPGSLDGIVSSPPYAESLHEGQGGTGVTSKNDRRNKDWQGWEQEHAVKKDGYGQTPGQIGQLREGDLSGVVTSPPYEGTEVGKPGSVHQGPEKLADGCGDIFKANGGERGNYDRTNGQIGNASGETYWQAMSAVYSQMRQAMRPGAVCAVVVKMYVKNKQLVDLPAQTIQLLRHLGFDVFLEVRAMLTRKWKEHCLFDGTVEKEKKRASFFRRLAEKKGSPKIDWESVLFARKPCENASIVRPR